MAKVWSASSYDPYKKPAFYHGSSTYLRRKLFFIGDISHESQIVSTCMGNLSDFWISESNKKDFFHLFHRFYRIYSKARHGSSYPILSPLNPIARGNWLVLLLGFWLVENGFPKKSSNFDPDLSRLSISMSASLSKWWYSVIAGS